MRLDSLKQLSNKNLLLNKGFLKKFEPKPNVLDSNIKYWLKKGELIGLKKGFYLLKDRYTAEAKKNLYLEYLAGQLLKPSYLTGEYVLAKYQILTEAVTVITSATTKTTRQINNKLSSFYYYNLTPKLFNGFTVKYFYNAPFLEATKDKALFDYLYWRFFKNATLNERKIQELRFNWENVSKSEFNKTYSYLKLINSQKMRKILGIIKEKYYAD